jgi:hypothetical protein
MQAKAAFTIVIAQSRSFGTERCAKTIPRWPEGFPDVREVVLRWTEDTDEFGEERWPWTEDVNEFG